MAAELFRFRFACPDPHQSIGCKAGQYIAVRAIIENEEVVRFYSPLSCPSETCYIELLIKIDGHGGVMSHYLANLQLGETLEIRGPLGGFQYEPNKYKHLVLIGMGAGIAAMMQIIREIAHEKRHDGDFALIYAMPTPADLIFLEELEQTQATASFKVVTTVDVPDTSWSGHVGYVDEALIRMVAPPPPLSLPAPTSLRGSDTAATLAQDSQPTPETVQFVLCGPPKAVRAIVAMLVAMGYQREYIYSYA